MTAPNDVPTSQTTPQSLLNETNHLHTKEYDSKRENKEELTETTNIDILFQDNDLLIVNKPAKLLTVPGRGPDKQDCLINRILVNFPSARIIHRLDMATSGIVVIALNPQTQADMSTLFAERQVEKTYIAVVAGRVEATGIITLPLICDWDKRPKQKVDHEHGKSAHTDFTCLSYDANSNTSRVELRPLTGRSHQLRVHMLATGHPILGDYFYAPEDIKEASSRLLLHAQQLRFIHPRSQRAIFIESYAPF